MHKRTKVWQSHFRENTRNVDRVRHDINRFSFLTCILHRNVVLLSQFSMNECMWLQYIMPQEHIDEILLTSLYLHFHYSLTAFRGRMSHFMILDVTLADIWYTYIYFNWWKWPKLIRVNLIQWDFLFCFCGYIFTMHIWYVTREQKLTFTRGCELNFKLTIYVDLMWNCHMCSLHFTVYIHIVWNGQLTSQYSLWDFTVYNWW